MWYWHNKNTLKRGKDQRSSQQNLGNLQLQLQLLNVTECGIGRSKKSNLPEWERKGRQGVVLDEKRKWRFSSSIFNRTARRRIKDLKHFFFFFFLRPIGQRQVTTLGFKIIPITTFGLHRTKTL